MDVSTVGFEHPHRGCNHDRHCYKIRKKTEYRDLKINSPSQNSSLKKCLPIEAVNTVRQEAMRPPVYELVSDLVIGVGRSQARSCSKIIWAWCSNLGIKLDEVLVDHIYKT